MNTCPKCGMVKGLHASILPGCMCLYSTPPQRTWVGLTVDEVDAAWGAVAWHWAKGLPELRHEYARDIEQLLKEKNT